LVLTSRDNAPPTVYETLLGVGRKTLTAIDYDDLQQRLIP
jgi:hypothetical protein